MIKPFNDAAIIVKAVVLLVLGLFVWSDRLFETFLKVPVAVLIVLLVARVVLQGFRSKKAIFDQAAILCWVVELILSAAMFALVCREFQDAAEWRPDFYGDYDFILYCIIGFMYILPTAIDCTFLWKYVGVLVKNLYNKQ